MKNFDWNETEIPLAYLRLFFLLIFFLFTR